MLLCDIGNTSYHFLDGEFSFKKSVASFNPLKIKEKVYYISVNQKINRELQGVQNWINLADYIDMKHYYKSMGIDRVVACEMVDNGVIVDAGSAITVDVVRDGVFEGGFIYAGSVAMQQTYKQISPALSYEFNFDINLKKLPKNSQDAISYGYLKPLYSEVNSYKLPIILTGGDAKKLARVFKDASVDELLIFKGMQKIIKETKDKLDKMSKKYKG